MSLKQNKQGFTIVELLIVIVVIAILAAISIVAYTGIQNRAKASSGQTAASQVAKKAAVAYTVSTNSQYPANPGAFTGEAALEGVTAVNYVDNAQITSATNYADGKTVIYRRTSAANGGCVYWWDFSASTPVQKPIYFGSVTTGC